MPAESNTWPAFSWVLGNLTRSHGTGSKRRQNLKRPVQSWFFSILNHPADGGLMGLRLITIQQGTFTVGVGSRSFAYNKDHNDKRGAICMSFLLY